MESKHLASNPPMTPRTTFPALAGALCALLCLAGSAGPARACMAAWEQRLHPLGTVPDGLVAVEWTLERSADFEPPHYWTGTARLVVLDRAQEVTRVIAATPVNTLGPGLRGTLVPLIRGWFEVAQRERGFSPLSLTSAASCAERFVCPGGLAVHWDQRGSGTLRPTASAAPLPLRFPTSFLEAHCRRWGIEDEPLSEVRRVLAEDAAEATAVNTASLDQDAREEHFTHDARFRLGVVRRYRAGDRTILVVGMQRGFFDRHDPMVPASEPRDPCACADVPWCWCPQETLHHGTSFDLVFVL